jgi:hypothetical protein
MVFMIVTLPGDCSRAYAANVQRRSGKRSRSCTSSAGTHRHEFADARQQESTESAATCSASSSCAMAAIIARTLEFTVQAPAGSRQAGVIEVPSAKPAPGAASHHRQVGGTQPIVPLFP